MLLIVHVFTTKCIVLTVCGVNIDKCEMLEKMLSWQPDCFQLDNCWLKSLHVALCSLPRSPLVREEVSQQETVPKQSWSQLRFKKIEK